MGVLVRPPAPRASTRKNVKPSDWAKREPVAPADSLFPSLPCSEHSHQTAPQQKGTTAWEASLLLLTSVISQNSSPAPPVYPFNILYWSLSQAIYLYGEDKILSLKLFIKNHRGYFCFLRKGKSLEAQPPFSLSNAQHLRHVSSWPEPLACSFVVHKTVS